MEYKTEKVWVVYILDSINDYGEQAMLFVDVYKHKHDAIERMEALEQNGSSVFISKMIRCKY